MPGLRCVHALGDVSRARASCGRTASYSLGYQLGSKSRRGSARGSESAARSLVERRLAKSCSASLRASGPCEGPLKPKVPGSIPGRPIRRFSCVGAGFVEADSRRPGPGRRGYRASASWAPLVAACSSTLGLPAGADDFFACAARRMSRWAPPARTSRVVSRPGGTSLAGCVSMPAFRDSFICQTRQDGRAHVSDRVNGGKRLDVNCSGMTACQLAGASGEEGEL